MEINNYIEELEKLADETHCDSHEYCNLEEPHHRADDILCEIISKYVEGGDKVVKFYKDIEKWYA